MTVVDARLIIIIIISYLFNVDGSKNFTIKNIYIALAIPVNDKDGTLIKVNENKKNYK